MNRLSRRQFLQASGMVVGATMAPSLALSRRSGAAEKELVPKKMPFPPNDEFGSYEPTITPDGNTIYFARFAGSGDKRVLGTTTDIFVTHRIRQTGPWPGPGSDWTAPERLPDTVNSDSIDQEPRITPDGNTLYFMSRRSGNPDIWVTQISGFPERLLIKYSVFPSGVIRGSWSMESLLTVSGSRSGGVQSAPVPGHSPVGRIRWVTKMSVVVPRTRLSPLAAKRAK